MTISFPLIDVDIWKITFQISNDPLFNSGGEGHD